MSDLAHAVFALWFKRTFFTIDANAAASGSTVYGAAGDTARVVAFGAYDRACLDLLGPDDGRFLVGFLHIAPQDSAMER